MPSDTTRSIFKHAYYSSLIGSAALGLFCIYHKNVIRLNIQFYTFSKITGAVYTYE